MYGGIPEQKRMLESDPPVRRTGDAEIRRCENAGTGAGNDLKANGDDRMGATR
jgi:hypothetical protein